MEIVQQSSHIIHNNEQSDGRIIWCALRTSICNSAHCQQSLW